MIKSEKSTGNEQNDMISELESKVNEHMWSNYHVLLDDLQLTATPGYWQDKEPKSHPNHPLHSFLGNGEPFKATYTYFDYGRANGRFSSRTKTWKILRELFLARDNKND